MQKGVTNGTVLAIYGYDEGDWGGGLRTSMAYPGGGVNYGFDARGRVVAEMRRIDGLGGYVTEYTYDALDRVRTTTYPDGEVVTQTYDSRGLADTLASSLGQPFVTGSTYWSSRYVLT